MVQSDTIKVFKIEGDKVINQLALPGSILQEHLFNLAFESPAAYQQEFIDKASKVSFKCFEQLVAELEHIETPEFAAGCACKFREAIVAHLATNLFLSIANKYKEITDTSPYS